MGLTQACKARKSDNPNSKYQISSRIRIRKGFQVAYKAVSAREEGVNQHTSEGPWLRRRRAFCCKTHPDISFCEFIPTQILTQTEIPKLDLCLSLVEEDYAKITQATFQRLSSTPDPKMKHSLFSGLRSRCNTRPVAMLRLAPVEAPPMPPATALPLPPSPANFNHSTSPTLFPIARSSGQ